MMQNHTTTTNYHHDMTVDNIMLNLPEANSKALSRPNCLTKLGVSLGNSGPHSRQELIKELDRHAKVPLEEVGV